MLDPALRHTAWALWNEDRGVYLAMAANWGISALLSSARLYSTYEGAELKRSELDPKGRKGWSIVAVVSAHPHTPTENTDAQPA